MANNKNIQRFKEKLKASRSPNHQCPPAFDFSDSELEKQGPSIRHSPRSLAREFGPEKSYRPDFDDCRYVSTSSKDLEMDDDTIYDEAEFRISASDFVDSAEVEITVKDGQVQIDGVVANKRLKKYIENQVAKTSGVKQIKSCLKIRSDS